MNKTDNTIIHYTMGITRGNCMYAIVMSIWVICLFICIWLSEPRKSSFLIMGLLVFNEDGQNKGTIMQSLNSGLSAVFYPVIFHLLTQHAIEHGLGTSQIIHAPLLPLQGSIKLHLCLNILLSGMDSQDNM